MRCLVTGAAGFVGQYLSQALLEEHHSVTGTAEHPGQGFARRPELAVGGIVWEELDVTQYEAVRSIIAATKPDWIFHLAAVTFVPQTVRAPVEAYRVNFQGTLHLLETVRLESPKSRVIFVSSAQIYGIPRYLPVDEQHPLAPMNPYSGSKAAADLLCFQYTRSFGMDIVRLRPFNHTGPGQDDSFAIPNFARQIAEMEMDLRPAIMKVGNLETERDFSDVRDVVRAYIAAAERGETGAAYNICSGKSHSIRELLDHLLSASRLKNIIVETDQMRLRQSEIHEIRGTHQRASQQLNWCPQIEIEQTLTDTLNGYRANLAMRHNPPSGRFPL